MPRKHVGQILLATPQRSITVKLASPKLPPRAPFAKAGCTIHKTHKPTPASSELHHIFPLYLQARVWADVDPNRPSTARNKDRVAVCGTGHSDVHLAIDALLATKRTPRGVGRTERALADLALLRFSDAKP